MIIVSRAGSRRFAFTAKRLPREYESGVGPLEFASVVGDWRPHPAYVNDEGHPCRKFYGGAS
jgi:hypothetical protein